LQNVFSILDEGIVKSAQKKDISLIDKVVAILFTSVNAISETVYRDISINVPKILFIGRSLEDANA